MILPVQVKTLMRLQKTSEGGDEKLIIQGYVALVAL